MIRFHLVLCLIAAILIITGCASRRVASGARNPLDPKRAEYSGPESEKLPMKNKNYGHGVYNLKYDF